MKEFERHERVAALKLTEIQKTFSEWYVEHFNGARAVRESGSKCTSTPSVVAKEWLNNPNRPSGESRKHTGC